MVKTLRWRDIGTGGAALHVAYLARAVPGSWDVHRHDFHEVFWVDSGKGIHLRGDGRQQTLVAGSLVFVRPADEHGFRSEASSEPFALINVAFPSPDWMRLKQEYKLARHACFHEQAGDPPMLELAGGVRVEVARRFRELLHRPRTPLVRDAFLLGLACLTETDAWEPGFGEAPAWLRTTLHAAEGEIETLRGGAATLARKAGYSLPHLARVMRETLGTSPTDWIRERRLRRAVQLLESTGFSVSDVAEEAGYENLSHFHRCFREAKGMSPLQFRKKWARAVL
jgi:AraC family cel operon transcriptional repressor